MSDKEEFRITLKCEGNCSETMEVVRIDWGDEMDYAIHFRADTFYAGQSPLGIIRERLKLAWLALRKGNYIHNEIITGKKELMRLRDELTNMLSDPNTRMTGTFTKVEGGPS